MYYFVFVCFYFVFVCLFVCFCFLFVLYINQQDITLISNFCDSNVCLVVKCQSFSFGASPSPTASAPAPAAPAAPAAPPHSQQLPHSIEAHSKPHPFELDTHVSKMHYYLNGVRMFTYPDYIYCSYGSIYHNYHPSFGPLNHLAFPSIMVKITSPQYFVIWDLHY